MAQSIAESSVGHTVEEEEEDFGPLLIKKLEVRFRNYDGRNYRNEKSR